MTKRFRWLIALCLGALVSPRLYAQTPGTQSAPATPSALSVTARLVLLDVAATDASGKPVEGLTVNDFRVLEDGTPQTIRSFETSVQHVLEASAVASPALVFNPAEPATFGKSPVTVLVLDQMNTRFADSAFARRCLREYLQAQPEVLAAPTTLLTVYDKGLKELQPFTRSRSELLHALETAPVKFAWTLETGNNADYGPMDRLEQSLFDVEQIAQSYARIPGRKNLLWVGGGFPTVDPEALGSQGMKTVHGVEQHITDTLLATRMTLNAVDPTSSAAGMTEISNEEQANAAGAVGESLGTNSGSFDADADFDRLSQQTGGRVVRGRNDVTRQIAAAVELGQNFYTLTYSPSSRSEVATKFRNIRVICLRPGVTVTTRTGYFPGDAEEMTSTASATYDLTTAAQSDFALNGLRVSAHAVREDPARSYVVEVGVTELAWQPKEDGSASASVYIMAMALDAKDHVLGTTVHPMIAKAQVHADLHDAKKNAEFDFVPVAPAKTTKMRFVVRDSATGRMGSVEVPVGMQRASR